MFRTDEIAARQKMEDIRSEIEYERMQSRHRKERKQAQSPFWIVLLTILHIRRSK